MVAILGAALAGLSCGSRDPLQGHADVVPARVHVGVDVGVAHVSDRFLSFAVDSAQVAGGEFWDPAGGGAQVPVARFDFTRPRLRTLTRELAPAVLRVGGTAADHLYYDMSAVSLASPPPPYRLVLDRTTWDSVSDFARELGLEILFTLNAGPGPRDIDRAWTADNARAFMSYVAARGDPVTSWELGNEINGYPIVHGMRVDGAHYARDMAVARALVDEAAPGTRLLGPSSAFWPVVGEAFPVLPSFLDHGGTLVDAVTWHFYPQQSRRCPIATRRAGPEVMLDPDHLAAVDRWGETVEAMAREAAPQAEVWLDETGNAQCGGEPGVSDRFVASLWWLDELGRVARRGQRLIVRQTLAGSDYGLLDDSTLEPNPDYWASVLWKRLIGTTMLGSTLEPEPSSRNVLSYAACTRGVPGGITVLAINLDLHQTVGLILDDGLGEAAAVYGVTGPDLLGKEVRLNGRTLLAGTDGAFPALEPRRARVRPATVAAALPPTSYAFVVLPDAHAKACE